MNADLGCSVNYLLLANHFDRQLEGVGKQSGQRYNTCPSTASESVLFRANVKPPEQAKHRTFGKTGKMKNK